MSNHLAIAAVTATLQRVLQATVQEDVFGARVTTARPNALEGGLMETGVNIYLYLVTPNPAFGTPDQPTRRPARGGDLVKRTLVASDLQFLMSFYGSEADLEPQRLLGSVIRTFQNVYTLTSDMIAETLSDPAFPYLLDCDLTEQLEPVRITPTEISVENLSKIWSVFFQTPYALSVTYKASVLMLEGDQPGQRALPVRDRTPLVAPFRQIVVERVVAQTGAQEPILTTSTLAITGRNLYAPGAVVRIGNLDLVPDSVTSTQAVLSLAQVPIQSLQAGLQGLQVVHPRPQADPRSPGLGSQSNLVGFVLRPRVLSATVEDVDTTVGGDRSAAITVNLDVWVGQRQRVVLILNRWSATENQAFLFKAAARADASQAITIRADPVPPGDYLVRVQVNDAESLLEIDSDRTSPTYGWYMAPRVQIA